MFQFTLTSTRPALAAGLLLLSALSLQAQRTTLVTEGFTGTGIALNDTTADTFSESLTSTGGSPTWVAATNFLDNGGVNSTTGSRCAYLNLGSYVTDATGTPQGKFELTMTIAPVTGAWISLGFAAENTPNLGKNFTNNPTSGAATTGVGTVIYRSSTSSPAGELDLFGGPGNTSSLDGPDNNTGDRQLTVTLDLTPNGGYDGITHFGTVTWSDSVLGVLGIHTFTSLRNFGSLLVSVPASSSGTVSALTLSQLDVNADTTAPALQFTVPASASTGAGTNANLAMSFNEVVKAGTGTITLRKTTGDVLVESFDVATSPQITFSGGSMIIDPTSNLLPGVQYYVLIPSGAVQDTSGNPYAGITAPGTWSFTTDSTPPALTGTAPANQAASIPVQANLVLHFDEPVQTGSGTITVHDAGTGTVLETIDVANPGAVTVSGRSVLITRTVPLAVNTTCYVRAGAGTFTDLSGLPWAGINNTTTLAFTTWAAAPLIAEYFFGVGGPLGGTEADAFDASISSVGGSGSWVAAANHLDNGSISTGVQTSAYLSLGTFLNNELGAANGLFDLTMTLSPVTGAWISLGFAAETSPNINKNFTNNGSGNATNNGLGTLIYRAQSGAVAPAVNGELDLFGGTANTNPIDGPDENTGSRTVTIHLDLTPAGGYDGVSNFGTVTWSDSVLGVLGSYTWLTQPTFGSIVISQSAGSTGMVSALTLTKSAPASATSFPLTITPNGTHFDFSWPSQAGKVYDLVSSTDLATPVRTWPVWDSRQNLPSAGATTTAVNVPGSGPRRFFAVIEK